MNYIRSYNELKTLKTFEERYEYLRLGGIIGKDTFGFDRFINQKLYTSSEWKRFRHQIILRDNGCDLGIEGYEIPRNAIIHHINPITVDDVINHDPKVFDPNNAILTTIHTHNAIHYGTDKVNPRQSIVERKENDTCPWRK